MTWTPDEVQQVQRSMLGSWPGTITAWGRDAFDAYLYVLQARGLDAADVLRAVGTWPAGTDFPPSAPNLAAAAMKDPGKPTFPEALRLIRVALAMWNRPLTGDYANEAEMLKAREGAVVTRAATLPPLVASFIATYKLDELQRIVEQLGDEKYGSVRRRDLEHAWDRYCEAFEGREVAALASGRRGELGAFDPLAALRRGGTEFPYTPKQVGSGSGA